MERVDTDTTVRIEQDRVARFADRVVLSAGISALDRRQGEEVQELGRDKQGSFRESLQGRGGRTSLRAESAVQV